jgi:hypothetical protein
MYQIRQYENEYVIGLLSTYSGLFTCYNCFNSLRQAIKAIKQYSSNYTITLN